MKEITVITPTFHSRDLAILFVKSFEKFKTKDFSVKYVIVENSTDISYKKEVLGLAEDIIFVNNPTDMVNSNANACGVEAGLKHANTEWIFVAHCDVFVPSSLFYSEMAKKMEEGYELIGTVLDPSPERIDAIHVSGYMVKSDIAKKISFYPRDLGGGKRLDVGDEASLYCEKNGIKNYCFRNTFNDLSLIDEIEDSYKGIYCDRCINDSGEVIFMHLGRGVPKTNKTYRKKGKTDLETWKIFCNGVLNG